MRLFFLLFMLVGSIAAAKRPLRAPRKVNALVTSPYSLEVKWRDPGSRQGARVKDGRKYLVRLQVIGGHKLYQPDVANSTGFVGEPAYKVEDDKVVRLSKRKLKLHGLLPNTTYAVSVKVMKGKRSSSWSDVIEITTFEEKIDEYAVQNVTATAMSSSSVALMWQPPEKVNEILAYRVTAQATNGKARQRKAVLSNEWTSFIVNHLKPNQPYSFTIQSMKAVAPHPMSRPVIARPFTARPSRPPNSLKLTATNSSTVIVSWKPPLQRSRNGQLTGYRISYKIRQSPKGQARFVNVGKDQKVYELRDLAANATYNIRVAAKNINGSGPYTKWGWVFMKPSKVNVKPAEVTNSEDDNRTRKAPESQYISPRRNPEQFALTPTDLKVVNRTGMSLFLTWRVSYNTCCPASGYKIRVQNLNDSSEDARQLVTPKMYVNIIDLYPETWYEINVTPLTLVGEGNVSEPLIEVTSGFVPPEVIHLQAKPKAVNIGEDARLICKAKGQELPSIKWYFRTPQGYTRIADLRKANVSFSKRTRKKGHDLMTSSLTLREVTRSAEREYVCVAKNSAGFKRASVTLEVHEPPEIVYAEGMTVLAESRARLVCEARGKPLPNIVWIHETARTVIGEPVLRRSHRSKDPLFVRSTSDPEASTRLSYLEVPRVVSRNSGRYACVARSSLGQARTTVVLGIKAPLPPVVSKIQTIALSPSRISVNWLPPLNYSYGIQFYQVSYRKLLGNGQVLYKSVSRVGTELYGLEHNTAYLIGVIAGTERGLGDAGPEVKVTTLSNERLEPTNVSTMTLNSSAILLKWETPSHVNSMYIRGFKIHYRREEDEIIEQRYIGGAQHRQFVIGGLEQDAVYFLRVSTLMTWGYEASSRWITLDRRSYGSLPARPEGVRTVASHDGIELTWSRSRDVAIPEGFIVTYSPTSDPTFLDTLTLPANTSRIHLDKVKPLTEYTVSVQAFNRFGQSPSTFARATTPSYAPSNVRNAQVQPVSPTEVHLKWEEPRRGHVTRYHIRYWRPGKREKQSAWMTGNFRNYVAGSLRKNSKYRFEIIPYNGAIPGEAVVMFTSTLGDRPDGPPREVHLIAVNESTFVATWQPPDPDLTNGRVKGYRLVLKVKGGKRITSFRLNGSSRNFTFLDMDTSQAYQLRIAAMTVNGTGAQSPWVESTYAGDPQKPGAIENLIIKPDVTSISLAWSRPKFTGSRVGGYIVGYGRFIPDVFRDILPAKQENYTISGLLPNSAYVVSVRAFNRIGESKPRFREARTHRARKKTTPLLAPINLKVQSESPTSLRVTWVDPALGSVTSAEIPDGKSYLIRYSPMSGESYEYVKTSELSHRLTGLEPATSYEISVRAVADTRSSDWSLPVLNATHQPTPSSAPENITVQPVPGFPGELQLRWTQPRHSNGKIQEYIIYRSLDPTLSTKSWIVTATSRRQVKIPDILPHTVYYFRLQARNRVGYGPLSEVVAYRPETAPTPREDTDSVLQGTDVTYTAVPATTTEIPPESHPSSPEPVKTSRFDTRPEELNSVEKSSDSPIGENGENNSDVLSGSTRKEERAPPYNGEKRGNPTTSAAADSSTRRTVLAFSVSAAGNPDDDDFRMNDDDDAHTTVADRHGRDLQGLSSGDEVGTSVTETPQTQNFTGLPIGETQKHTSELVVGSSAYLSGASDETPSPHGDKKEYKRSSSERMDIRRSFGEDSSEELRPFLKTKDVPGTEDESNSGRETTRSDERRTFLSWFGG